MACRSTAVVSTRSSHCLCDGEAHQSNANGDASYPRIVLPEEKYAHENNEGHAHAECQRLHTESYRYNEGRDHNVQDFDFWQSSLNLLPDDHNAHQHHQECHSRREYERCGDIPWCTGIRAREDTDGEDENYKSAGESHQEANTDKVVLPCPCRVFQAHP